MKTVRFSLDSAVFMWVTHIVSSVINYLEQLRDSHGTTCPKKQHVSFVFPWNNFLINQDALQHHERTSEFKRVHNFNHVMFVVGPSQNLYKIWKIYWEHDKLNGVAILRIFIFLCYSMIPPTNIHICFKDLCFVL